jgi:tetratricopeptide (TPR) repeat protein
MLTTTKWTGWRFLAVSTVSMILIQACMPAGPRALLEGESLFRARKYTQAIDKLRVATDLLPGDGRAWNYLGLASHYAGQTQMAVRAYQRALTCRPAPTAARFNLGCLYLEGNNLPAAMEELITYTQSEPKSAEGWLRLGVAQLRSRQYPAAESSFSLALQLNASLAEGWNGLGLIRSSRGSYREASNYFNAALRYAPNYPAALLNQAIVLHQYLKNRPQALLKYREYLAAAGNVENLNEVQAIVAQLDQELAPAIVTPPASNATPQMPTQTVFTAKSPLIRTQITTASKTSLPLSVAPGSTGTTTPPPATLTTIAVGPTPGKPVYTASLSTNLVRPAAGKTTAAPPRADISMAGEEPRSQKTPSPVTDVAMTKPSRALPPKSIEPGFESSKTISPKPPTSATSSPVLPGTGRYPYQRTLMLSAGNRDEAEAVYQTGLKEQKAGRVLSAIQAYQKAIQSDPSYFEAHHNLGALAFQAGDVSLSLYAYERALIVHPAATGTRYNFALALERANFLQDAAAELEKVLVAVPSDTRARLALANLYAQQLSQPLLARQHYEKLLAIDPQHPQAAAIRYWLAANR